MDSLIYRCRLGASPPLIRDLSGKVARLAPAGRIVYLPGIDPELLTGEW